MTAIVNIVDDSNQSQGTIKINEPDICPLCHRSVTPYVSLGFINSKTSVIEIVFRCPNKKCKRVFIGYYHGIGNFPTFKNSEPTNLIEKKFSQHINTTSPNFSLIYNQALVADSLGLDEISGSGFGKALEFLIKDYVISLNPKEKEQIEKEFLSTVIRTRVHNKKVEEASSRASWLRNDETHYVRKWSQNDITDLKKLIDLIINWIELEVLHDEFLVSMPSPAPIDEK